MFELCTIATEGPQIPLPKPDTLRYTNTLLVGWTSPSTFRGPNDCIEAPMDYITHVSIENYACIRSLELELTPLHAFIGPNDSGKSSILRAIRTLVTFGGRSFKNGKDGHWDPFFPALVYGPKPTKLSLNTKLSQSPYCITAYRQQSLSELAKETDGSFDSIRNFGTPSALPPSPLRTFLSRAARFVHTVPYALRKPSQLQPTQGMPELGNENGEGLAAIFDAVMNRGDDASLDIRREVQKLFPHVKSIGLRLIAPGIKELEIGLTSGEKVPARHLSEGLLYYLLFACLKYLDPAAILLVEEPENGLHPARIAEVMKVLREISKTTQVLVATHSPLVINEMQPEEVTLVTRTADRGTQVRRLDKTKNFAERSKVYALGELWLSYADGELEAELMGEDTK